MTCQQIQTDFVFKGVGPGATDLVTSTAAEEGSISGSKNFLLSLNSTLGLGSESSTAQLEFAGHHGNPQQLAGLPCEFTCNGFQFGGVIKSVVKTENSAGKKTKFDLQCPKELLSDYDLFLNRHYCHTGAEDNGNVNNPYNFMNVHKLIEGGAVRCPPYPWARFADAPGVISPNCWNPNRFGRSAYTSGFAFPTAPHGSTSYATILEYANAQNPTVAGPGVTDNFNLWIDLSGLIGVARRIPYACTSATKINVLELATSVCEEAGYDFHCTIEGLNITFKFIYRGRQTTFGAVQQIIERAKNSNTDVASSYGAEIKRQKTSRVVIGSPVEYVAEVNHQASSDGYFILGFGAPFATDAEWPIMANTSGFSGVPYPANDLNNASSLNGFPLPEGLNNVVYLDESELLMSGTLAMWKAYGYSNANSISRLGLNTCQIYSSNTSNRFFSSINRLSFDPINSLKGIQEALKSTTIRSPGAFTYDEVWYPWIRNIYDTYYGKYYMATIANNGNIGTAGACFHRFGGTGGSQVLQGQGGNFKITDEPSASAWPDYEGAVLGNSFLGPFLDSAGKLTCFVRMPLGDNMGRYGFDYYTNLGLFEGEYIVVGSNVYARAEVDGRFYEMYTSGDRNSPVGLPVRPCIGVVIKMPSMLTMSAVQSTLMNNPGLRALEQLIGINADGSSKIGNSSIHGGTYNVGFTNVFRELPAAGRFHSVAIPMKSNVYNYGPFNGSSGETGGTDIVVREDLNPWEMGGYNAMSAAGTRLATDGLPSRTRYESGSITIAEAPFQSLGSDNIDTGPLLASIVTKFDAGGATTTYNYQVFKPKFGNSSERFTTILKQNTQYRRDAFNVVRERYMQQLRTQNKALVDANKIRMKFFEQFQQPLSINSATPSSVMILSYPTQPGFNFGSRGGGGGGGGAGRPGQPTLPLDCEELKNPSSGGSIGGGGGGGGGTGGVAFKAEVGLLKSYDADYFGEDNFQAYAVVSLDMLFTPVAVTQNGYMPGLAVQPSSIAGYYTHRPIAAMPPFYANNSPQGVPIINNTFLNPYSTTALINTWDGRGPIGQGGGVSVDYLSWGSDPSNALAIDPQTLSDRQNNYNPRGAALRGPLMLSGWGYDTNGKPIPNSVDSASSCQQGYFKAENCTNRFMTDWISAPDTWPTGPIDLRWDRHRGVWVSPPSEKLVICQLTSNLFAGSVSEAVMIDPHGDFYPSTYTTDQGGQLNSNTKAAKVFIKEPLGRSYAKGTTMVCYHYGNGNYIPIHAMDTSYKFTTPTACCSERSQGEPCYVDPNPDCEFIQTEDVESMVFPVQSFTRLGGFKVIHDLRDLLYSPMLESLVANPGELHAMVAYGASALGVPCFSGVRIVDCSGDYPGGPPVRTPLPPRPMIPTPGI